MYHVRFHGFNINTAIVRYNAGIIINFVPDKVTLFNLFMSKKFHANLFYFHSFSFNNDIVCVIYFKSPVQPLLTFLTVYTSIFILCLKLLQIYELKKKKYIRNNLIKNSKEKKNVEIYISSRIRLKYIDKIRLYEVKKCVV